MGNCRMRGSVTSFLLPPFIELRSSFNQPVYIIYRAAICILQIVLNKYPMSEKGSSDSKGPDSRKFNVTKLGVVIQCRLSYEIALEVFFSISFFFFSREVHICLLHDQAVVVVVVVMVVVVVVSIGYWWVLVGMLVLNTANISVFYFFTSGSGYFNFLTLAWVCWYFNFLTLA
ncbi:hypothetical protein L9F63_008827, partial [Diploptera punctata]